jgi:hypothetical protein
MFLNIFIFVIFITIFVSKIFQYNYCYILYICHKIFVLKLFFFVFCLLFFFSPFCCSKNLHNFFRFVFFIIQTSFMHYSFIIYKLMCQNFGGVDSSEYLAWVGDQ